MFPEEPVAAGPLDTQWRAVEALARRVLGPLGERVRVRGLDVSEEQDPHQGRAAGELTGLSASGQAVRGSSRTFVYRARAGTLDIAATDGISASVGLHTYLRRVCGRSVGWDTPLPLGLGALPDCEPFRARARVGEGSYFNFCTFSYTTAYWTWDDWQREIDWMALHGITMPLAAVGHEATLLLAYERLGLAEDEILRFLGGPGYLPFQFMGCVDGFAGPLPRTWVDGHRELGRRIVRRQHELGMTPMLPSFAGNVPRALAPSKVTTRTWVGFETYFLDPADPLYREVGRRIAEAQREIFGTGHHLYAADPFIEMLPVGSGTDYPREVAAATVAGLRAADPEAVWTMQAWPFSFHRGYWTDEKVGAFLDALGDDEVLLLDLWGEADPQWQRLESFRGKPWLWCALLNFGGRTDLIGNLRGLARSIESALGAGRPPVGIGLSMEAIHTNPVFFELAVEHIWFGVGGGGVGGEAGGEVGGRVAGDVGGDIGGDEAGGVGGWLGAFAAQRYGTADPEPALAWRELLATVYDTGDKVIDAGIWSSVLTRRPSLLPFADPEGLRRGVREALWYDPAVLADAWERLLRCAERDPSLAAGPLGHDLVDVAVAAMARVADRLHLDVVEHLAGGGDQAGPLLERFLAVFPDLDRLLDTRPEFTLSRWESQATSWATTPDESRLLLDNARRILTVWDSPARPTLHDYAARIWSGLTGAYYHDRWSLWRQALTPTAISSPTAHEPALITQLQSLEASFLSPGTPTPPAAPGDVTTESRRLLTHYGPVLTALPNAPH